MLICPVPEASRRYPACLAAGFRVGVPVWTDVSEGCAFWRRVMGLAEADRAFQYFVVPCTCACDHQKSPRLDVCVLCWPFPKHTCGLVPMHLLWMASVRGRSCMRHQLGNVPMLCVRCYRGRWDCAKAMQPLYWYAAGGPYAKRLRHTLLKACGILCCCWIQRWLTVLADERGFLHVGEGVVWAKGMVSQRVWCEQRGVAAISAVVTMVACTITGHGGGIFPGCRAIGHCILVIH
jgi:hypothetical protein